MTGEVKPAEFTPNWEINKYGSNIRICLFQNQGPQELNGNEKADCPAEDAISNKFVTIVGITNPVDMIGVMETQFWVETRELTNLKTFKQNISKLLAEKLKRYGWVRTIHSHELTETDPISKF